MKKKLLSIFILTLALICIFASCNETPDNSQTKISVGDDGYLIVNGIETKYKVDTEDVITTDADGYLVVNGNKTEYRIFNNSIGDSSCDHSYSEFELYNKSAEKCDEKLYYRVCSECSRIEWKQGTYYDHDWDTVTTQATCQAGGYDTKTCNICGAKEICNETNASDHNYGTEYISDNSFHWFKCADCDATTAKNEHTVGNDGNCSVCSALIGDTAGVIYDVSSDRTYAEVIGYEGEATGVRIAEEYNGLPVTNIYSEAFKENRNITAVVIPDSVTSIGGYAFAYCNALESVVIPDSMTSIGDYAFAWCSALESVDIGNSVTSIGGYAFAYCNALESVVIPDSVTSIGAQAFEGCYALESVDIGNSVTSIGEWAFAYCSALESVDIGNSVTSIGGYAFYDCDALESVDIGNSVTSIGAQAFYDCNALESVDIGNSVTSIGDCAFYNCYALESVVIGNSVTSIGAQAFEGCYALESVDIGNSVTSIGEWAFYYCSALQSVVIGNGVTKIGYAAFADCSALTDVYYTGTEEKWEKISIEDYNYDLLYATINYNYVPEK